MPPAKQWTEQADQTIRQMRGSGQTWSAIGVRLGLSRNTVIERGRRLCALAPKRASVAPVVKIMSDDPNRGALPAGHPVTWGLLSDEPFPGLDGHEASFLIAAPRDAVVLGISGRVMSLKLHAGDDEQAITSCSVVIR